LFTTSPLFQVITKLHSLLKPFMLRRMKADVEIALPRKQELLLYAPMSDAQRALNRDLLDNKLAVRVEGVWCGPANHSLTALHTKAYHTVSHI
jgi:SNF2 family DNA or RNA helicase